MCIISYDWAGFRFGDVHENPGGLLHRGRDEGLGLRVTGFSVHKMLIKPHTDRITVHIAFNGANLKGAEGLLAEYLN